jgi:cell division septum initiation protein DivIVA
MDKLRLQTRTELDSFKDKTKKARLELEQSYERCTAQNLKLQTEVNDLRKEMTKHKDLAKLRKVANAGPGTMLKNKKTSTLTTTSTEIPILTKQDSL